VASIKINGEESLLGRATVGEVKCLPLRTSQTLSVCLSVPSAAYTSSPAARYRAEGTLSAMDAYTNTHGSVKSLFAAEDGGTEVWRS
jgi:hypothetical protein